MEWKSRCAQYVHDLGAVKVRRSRLQSSLTVSCASRLSLRAKYHCRVNTGHVALDKAREHTPSRERNMMSELSLKPPATVDECTELLRECGWSVQSPILVESTSMEIDDIELWEVHHDEPTVVLFLRREHLNEQIARRDAQRICRLTPARSMILFSAATADDTWALAVCPTWKEKTRVLLGKRHAQNVHETDCMAVVSRTALAVEAAVRLTVQLDKRETSHAFFRAVCSSATRVDLAWSSPNLLTDDDRRELTIMLFCRLLFLYFLERKRWLGDATGWIVRNLLGAKASCVWSERLRPLFFEVLNCPVEDRNTGGWADVPYLNGGLFDLNPLEKQHQELTLSNEAIENLLLDVFERYRFVDSEVPDRRAAVDPEMLGVVFERLMNRERRSSSGAFFTPPSVARRHVEEAIEDWLRLIPGADKPSNESDSTTRLERLKSITLLDPACGSGTFLLTALHVLEKKMLRELEFTSSAPSTLELRREIITNSLYGVDISPLAVRVAELRLWLAVIESLPDEVGYTPPPLPNLSLNLIAGDFLIEEGSTLSPAEMDGRGRSLLKRSNDARAVFIESHGVSKRDARHHADQAAAALAEHLVDVWQQSVVLWTGQQSLCLEHEHLSPDAKSTPKNSALAKTASEGPSCEAVIQREQDIKHVADSMRLAISRGWTAGHFCSTLHFAPVIASGGFDVIVGNPPWVRWTELPELQRSELRARYQVLQPAPGAFHGAQPDLCYAFVERGYRLLKDHGVMGLLLSAKLLRSDSGYHFRKFVTEETNLRELNDYSRRSERVFDADAYTLFLRLAKRTPAETDWLRIIGDRGAFSCRQRELVVDGGCPGSPWLLANSAEELHRVRDALRGHGSLSVGEQVVVRYGVKTGCNRALLNPAFESEFVVRAVRGRDLGELDYQADTKLVFLHDKRLGSVIPDPPAEVLDSLRPYKSALLARSDMKGDEQWWRVFRVREEALGHRVAWPDVARKFAPVYLPPVIDGGPVALNTVYSFAVESRAEAERWIAWLRSDDVQLVANTYADTALSGYRRFRSAVISRLPGLPGFDTGSPQSGLALRPSPFERSCPITP